MSSRRDFIKKAAFLSGAAGFANAIQKALAINPVVGTTFMDAEHVVILMQENRSFDHCFGTLRGVRGFDDPHAVTLPDKNPVWLQSNKAGQTFAPFRLNINDTRATWMGSLPHSWTNQVDAHNDGKMDKWLDAKKSGHPAFADMPLTMGYYTREDLPFYYSMADAFTVCDQNFCSALTGTTPNRLFFWTGTIRDEQHENVKACVANEDADYETPVAWKTFPEILEEQGVSWRVYQNEISAGVGFTDEEDRWLSSFSDNPLEFFTQFHVQFAAAYMTYLPAKIRKLGEQIHSLEQERNSKNAATSKVDRLLEKKNKELKTSIEEAQKYTPENFERLTPFEKNLHRNAFSTNAGDADYHALEKMATAAGSMIVPKGDVLYQFREDVKNGKLPTVSWLVAPENLSDHPSAPWYGAAYISEAIDILTHDPEVWKKTIFILAYDENDGYFDHVPPFTAPHPDKPELGAASDGIDTRVDYVKLSQDKKWRPSEEARESPVGLGFRVPLIIASPWSRGGAVNSQVFDHTSTLQFLEKFLSKKTEKKIAVQNISSWRRAVCGDLTSVFKPYNGEALDLPVPVGKVKLYSEIYAAKLKKDPGDFQEISQETAVHIRSNPADQSVLPRQEQGTRPSCALPYELFADGNIVEGKGIFELRVASSNQFFGERTAGSPFNIYAYNYKTDRIPDFQTSSLAVAAGKELKRTWRIKAFTGGSYRIKIHGPNGFTREYKGSAKDPDVLMLVKYQREGELLTGNIIITVWNRTSGSVDILIDDRSYKMRSISKTVRPNELAGIPVDLAATSGWYDLGVTIAGFPDLEKRYAGRAENGSQRTSDPAIGRS